jgi:signal transduction histidine kinase
MLIDAVHPTSVRLQVVSRSFVAVVSAAVLLNLLLLLAMHRAGQATQAAIDHREAAQSQVGQLLQETDLLAHLVQRFVVTGQPRYQALYDDILAVRRGEHPPPAATDIAAYWRSQLAGGAARSAPRASTAQSLAQRLQATRWSAEEMAAWQAALQAAEPLLAIERVAIAARNNRPVGADTAAPAADRERALALVQSDAYDAHRAELTAAVNRLNAAVASRSQAEVDAARRREQHAKLATLLVNLLLIPVLLAAIIVMRHQVLRPIAQLVATARRYAAGDYSAPQQAMRASTDELDTLADALQRMADATAEELRRRDLSQRELRAARDAAEAAAQTKAMFLANMSHEIRTPMNAIMGMTQLAMRTPLTLRQRDYLDKSLAASRHLLGLIDDVLDFSKIEAGGMALELRPLVLEEVAAQALSLVRQRASDKRLTLLLVVADGALLQADGRLLGDALRLGQVLTNLLSNAVKFTPSGSVTLTLARDESAANTPAEPGAVDTLPLCLSVADTGIGLSAEQIDGLFRQFSQETERGLAIYGAVWTGLSWKPRVAARRLRAAMLRWRCCSS